MVTLLAAKTRRKTVKKLYVIGGPIKGKSFNLNDDVTTVGRSSDNDICISDIGVSRHHAKFVKKDDRVSIVDLAKHI